MDLHTKKEYDKALRQAKALDRQFDENGARVFTLAEQIYNDQDYDNAIDAYDYIVKNHGRNTSFYLDAKRGLLNSKKSKVTQNFDYKKEDLSALKAEYISFLNEIGRNTQTAPMMQEFADFEALYLNELDTAIIILEEMRQFGGMHPESIAKAKLALGDSYLMNGDRWEPVCCIVKWTRILKKVRWVNMQDTAMQRYLIMQVILSGHKSNSRY